MGKAVTGLNKPNSTAYFFPVDDNWESKLMPCKASVAFAEGAAMGIEISGNTTTGNITLMGVENASGGDFVGIMQEPVVSTDADYATAGKMKMVLIPRTKAARAKFKVVAGTFTAADVGKTVEFSSDSLGLAVDTAGKGARITEYVTANEGICTFDLPTTETA